MLTIPVDSYGEQPTCLCGLGADGMGSSTWAPCVFNADNVAVIIPFSDPRLGQYEVCLDCGLVVAELDEQAPPASVADALLWSEAARAVVFEYRRSLHVWPVIGYVSGWVVAPGADEAAQGYTEPTRLGRY